MGKIAIALGGGGTRGAYQMGVWKALRELKIKIDIAVGTSVGALMGAIMAQGDYDSAEKIWKDMNESFVINKETLDEMEESPKKSRLIFIKNLIENGGADITPLENNMGTYIDEDKIRESSMDFGLVTVEYPTLKSAELSKNEIPKGKLADYIIASASCFPAFRAKDIDGVKYIDGGYYDNLPINLAFRMGADSVIAIDLHSVGIIRQPKDKKNKGRIIYITSPWDLGNFLCFDKECVSKNMALGYNETMKTFGALDGDVYTFDKGEELLNFNKNNGRYNQVYARLNLDSVKSDRSPVTSIITRRLLNKIGGNRKNNWENMTALAELTGEIFEIDPAPVYKFDDFNNLLKQALENSLEEIKEVSTAKGLKEQLDSIKGISRQYIVALIYRRLVEGAISFDPNMTELGFISFAFPSEIAAAFYMLIINLDTIINQ